MTPSKTFEKIVERLTNDSLVYRNKFIEPYDSRDKGGVTKLEGGRISDEEFMSEGFTKEQASQMRKGKQVRKQSPLDKLPREEKIKFLQEMDEEQNSRIDLLSKKIQELEERLFTDDLKEEEIDSLSKIETELSKLEGRKEKIKKELDGLLQATE